MGDAVLPGNMIVIEWWWKMDHRRAKEQLEAYVVGGLDPAARDAVARHLADCIECRQLADDLAVTANLLPLALAAASPLQPPDGLKSRVLSSLRTAVAEPLSRTDPRADAEQPEPPPTRVATANGADLVSRLLLGDPSLARGPVSRLPRQGRWRSLAAVAALVVLALSLAWGVRLSAALDEERALRERVAAHFTQQQEIVLEVVDADDATRLILRSPDPDSNAYGKLFTRPDLPHVVVMAARLPVPPVGQTYHLWLTSRGHTFLAGVLPVNDQGFGLLTFDADQNGPVYETAQLTLQPAGAEAPGGETALAWSV